MGEREGKMKGSEVDWLRGNRTGMKAGFVLSSGSEQEAALCLKSGSDLVTDIQYAPMNISAMFA